MKALVAFLVVVLVMVGSWSAQGQNIRYKLKSGEAHIQIWNLTAGKNEDQADAKDFAKYKVMEPDHYLAIHGKELTSGFIKVECFFLAHELYSGKS